MLSFVSACRHNQKSITRSFMVSNHNIFLAVSLLKIDGQIDIIMLGSNTEYFVTSLFRVQLSSNRYLTQSCLIHTYFSAHIKYYCYKSFRYWQVVPIWFRLTSNEGLALRCNRTREEKTTYNLYSIYYSAIFAKSQTFQLKVKSGWTSFKLNQKPVQEPIKVHDEKW